MSTSETGFGEYLKRLRQTENLSQKDLADRLSVSPKAVSKWETERGYPDIGNLKAFADCFRLTLDDVCNCTLPSESSPEETPTADTQSTQVPEPAKTKRKILLITAAFVLSALLIVFYRLAVFD